MKNTIRYIFIVVLAVVLPALSAHARPRVAVNIVVSGMRGDDLVRYGEQFGTDGFSRLLGGGLCFTECYADFLPTSTAVCLATIATGTQPSTHGISTTRWYERSSRNVAVTLGRVAVEDNYSTTPGVQRGYTTSHINSQTLAESVASSGKGARVVTIAHDALSAIMLAGRGCECYWLDEAGEWTTADCYASQLPAWVKAHNEIGFNKIYVRDSWMARFPKSGYRNTRHSDIVIYDPDVKGGRREPKSSRKESVVDYRARMMFTPAGNSAILEFAKKALNQLLAGALQGEQGEPQMLNICLDAPRYIVEKYGPDSMEYEDMLYCLDLSLAEFLTHLLAQVKSTSEVVVTLCSDHGTSPTSAVGDKSAERFNVRQAEVILNAFLSARHGQDNWVLGCHDRGIYLDHELIYKRGKSLPQIQHEVATFALQLRGVASALTATTLSGGAFPSGVQHLVQNGFSPRRSGDVMLTLLPRRIESDAQRVSATGSPYNYDRHLPLIIYGGGVEQGVERRRTDIASLAPSIALLLGVPRPDCSDAEVLDGVVKALK